MAHPVGEKLRCDDCGAEIVYLKACACPEKEPKAHSNICCSKEMRSLGVHMDELAGSSPKKIAS